MTKIFLKLFPILLAGCGFVEKNHNVQQGGISLKKARAEYVKQCKQFPYPDGIYVDRCFDFSCKEAKFRLWNQNCNEIGFAKDIIAKNQQYFIDEK